jgi:60 kDa SS-A/Ro ribonucleoprotein
LSYLKSHGTRRVSQRLPLPGQVPNSAGGNAWAVDAWARLRRFLVLGSEGGSYYASEWTLTRENAQAVEQAVREDGLRAVAEVVAVSRAGRAPKNQPALFALALAAGVGDTETRKAALSALPEVARTGTHLFQFAGYVEQFRGWGRSLRRAVGGWYTERPVDAVAYQAVKYRQREGYTHRDLLRLSHPASQTHAPLFEWVVRGGDTAGLPRVVEGFARVQVAATAAEAAALVREYGLPREAVPPEHLTSPDVWEALLDEMPMTALIRNLATMTRVGVVAPGAAGTARVVAQLGDAERLRKARVHPFAVLAALRTYAAGRGARGRGVWSPVREVVDALDAAFYASFGNVEPAGTRQLLALDVSGSMTWGEVAGIPGLTPRDASAALALITTSTESNVEIVGFSTTLMPLAISPRQRLDDAIRVVSGLPFAGTDVALPMLYAQKRKREVDTFVVYTDSETWFGDVHPAQALQSYRQASGIDARLVVVGMVSNGFSVADPDDPGMLDVVGFDTATPQLISDFARGAL